MKTKKVEIGSSFSDWLDDRMQELRITNAELARRTGISQEMVRQYKKGSVPNADKLWDLEIALSVEKGTISKILAGEKPARAAPPPDAASVQAPQSGWVRLHMPYLLIWTVDGRESFRAGIYVEVPDAPLVKHMSASVVETQPERKAQRPGWREANLEPDTSNS